MRPGVSRVFGCNTRAPLFGWAYGPNLLMVGYHVGATFRPSRYLCTSASLRRVARQEVDDAQRQLGHRLRELREEAGLRLEDVAEAAGLSWGFVGDVERGRRAASLAVLVRWADALDVTVVDVLDSIPAYARRR